MINSLHKYNLQYITDVTVKISTFKKPEPGDTWCLFDKAAQVMKYVYEVKQREYFQLLNCCSHVIKRS